jgi:hypothetical protein
MFYVADKSRSILKAGKGEDSKQTIYLNLLHDRNNLANVLNEKTKQMKKPKPEKTKLIHDWKDKLLSRLNVINIKRTLQTTASNTIQEDDCCCRGGGGGGGAVDQNDSAVFLRSDARSEFITYSRLCSDSMIIIIVVINFVIFIFIIITIDSYGRYHYLVELAASLPHKTSSIHLFDTIQCHHQTPITVIDELSLQHHDQSVEITLLTDLADNNNNINNMSSILKMANDSDPALFDTVSPLQNISISDIQEGTTDQQSNLVWHPLPDIPTDYESVFLQQIKCSKSRLLIEVGTILVTLLPITEDETTYRLCCVLSVIYESLSMDEGSSMDQPIAVRVFDGFKV